MARSDFKRVEYCYCGVMIPQGKDVCEKCYVEMTSDWPDDDLPDIINPCLESPTSKP